MESFKKRIQDYELALEHNEIPTERQKINSEFFTVKDPIISAAINDNKKLLDKQAENIRKKHIKQIAKNQRQIKKAVTFRNFAISLKIKPLVEIAEKKLEKEVKNRVLLQKDMEFDWQSFQTEVGNSHSQLDTTIEAMIEDTIINDMKSKRDKSYTNEELESILGKERLRDAIQDKNRIENIFQRLLHHFTTEEEGEKRI